MKTLLGLSIISLVCLSDAYSASRKRDVYNYVLKDGREIVYIGQTKNPVRRFKEHLRDGKEFSRMTTTGGLKTLKGARKAERKALARYRKSHRGYNPDYNQTNHG